MLRNCLKGNKNGGKTRVRETEGTRIEVKLWTFIHPPSCPSSIFIFYITEAAAWDGRSAVQYLFRQHYGIGIYRYIHMWMAVGSSLEHTLCVCVFILGGGSLRVLAICLYASQSVNTLYENTEAYICNCKTLCEALCVFGCLDPELVPLCINIHRATGVCQSP